MFRKMHDGKIPIPHRASLRKKKRRRTNTPTESEGTPERRTRQPDQNELLQNMKIRDGKTTHRHEQTSEIRAQNSRKLDRQEN